MKRWRKTIVRGFTLLEALLAAVVLAMSVGAITMPFSAGIANQQADARRTLAVSLAQEMMEEILALPFNDPQGASQPGPEAGETTRSRFDNIDDYHGYTENPGHIASADGTPVTDPIGTGMSRRVTASYVFVSGQDQSKSPTFICVTVEVRHQGVALVTLSRLVYANQH